MRNKSNLIHAFAFSLITVVFGVSFDAWWHVSEGRETFFALPHLFIYGGVSVSLSLSFLLMRKTHQRIWRKIFIALLGIPITAPFDELWHRIIGIEHVENASIVWSPPHMLLFTAAILAVALFIPIVKKDRDIVSNRVLGKLMLASLLSLVFIILVPLFPLGPHHLLGFWGAGVTAFLFTNAVLATVYLFPGIAAATIMALFFIIFHIIFADANINNPAARIYGHIPNWLLILSYIIPAIWIDLSKNRPIIMRATTAAALWSIIFFGLANIYLESDFAYSTINFYQALLSSLLAGTLSGILFHYALGNMDGLKRKK